MHHFRAASHHPAGHHAATHHAPAHMAVLVPWSSLPAVPFCAKTGTIRPPRPAARMAMLVSDAHANSPLAVKRFPKAGSRPGRGTRLEKPSSWELSFLGSAGGRPHHALGGR